MDAAAQKKVQDKLYDDLKKQFDGVATWDAFYEKLGEYFTQFRRCGCEYHAFHTVLMQQAFILSLRELPEEGDIVNIIEHMINLVAYQTHEKFGYQWISMADLAQGASALEALAALAQRQQVGHGHGEEPAEQKQLTAPPKKVVH